MLEIYVFIFWFRYQAKIYIRNVLVYLGVVTKRLVRSCLDSQAVLVDMEEGVVNEILQGPLREVFDSTQLLTDVSGSGNNW